jgi:hypothetical protein
MYFLFRSFGVGLLYSATRNEKLRMAEREGFEPSVEVFPLHSLSRRAP